MNGQTLLDLTTELLAGRVLGTTLFLQLLNNAKARREARRAWMKIRTVDSSNTVTAATTYQSSFAFPSRFLRFYGKYPIRLVSGTSVIKLEERPLEELDELQTTVGYFCVDYANSLIYITGTWNQSYATKIFYCKKSADITLTTAWTFPDEYHPMLAFDVAIQQKGDIDYDEINARMVLYHGKSVSDIESAMVLWDANLQTSSKGV